jgi:heat shock protein HslJ
MARPWPEPCFTAIALTLTAAVLLMDGSSTARAQPKFSELQGTFWRFDSINGSSHDQSKVIMRISRHWIDISAPCEYALFPFGYASGSLRFHPALARETLQGSQCPRSVVLSAIETGLARVSRYAVNADGLTFLDDNDRPIVALSRVIATGLENREWSISQYWDGKALVAAEQHAHIVFRNGRVDGSAGCGPLKGHYSLSGQHLKLWVTAMLAGWCPPPALVQLDRIVEALRGDWLVEAELVRTVLRDEQGAMRIILHP